MTPGEITCKATPHSCRTGMRYLLLMTSSILIDGREKDMRTNILETISTWNVLESLEELLNHSIMLSGVNTLTRMHWRRLQRC